MPAFPTTGHRALRRGRTSIPGHIYLLTTTTCRRQRWFADPEPAHIACRVIATQATWGDADLLAWVLMPDHWHGLLRLGNEPLERVMNRFKGLLSRDLRAAGKIEGQVWDRGFHDHALRAEESVRQAARYLVANPVRAGLTRSVLAYPYWNAIWLDGTTPL